MKKYFEKLIRAKEQQAQEIRDKVKKSEDVNEVRALGETLEKVLQELNDAKEQLAKLDDEDSDTDDAKDDTTKDDNAKDDAERMRPLASYGTRSAVVTGSTKVDLEKRVAFANYVTLGREIPAEMRAATTTTNTANAIPENLIDEILEKIDAVGMILPLLTKTSFPVGQKIPVDSVKPSASWVGEGQGSTVQTKGTLGAIVFGAFKLRCEIGMTQEVTVQTIAAFEKLFVKQVSEAMVKAIESKVVSADDGSTGNPKGILYNANEATTPDAKVEIAAGTTEHLTYKTLCDMEAMIPQQYETGSKWFMTKKTFMAFVAMVDSVGQPIARINYGINGKAERTLMGRDVILCGDYMDSYDEGTATKDKVIAFLFDPSDYVLNTSYDLGIQSKIDWDNEDHRTKAVMSVDGAVIDRNSLVKLVKKYK
mgnify:CR=1 FL=1|nr:MAG TPA: major capsid protein [Caudoviricetes sp.]